MGGGKGERRSLLVLLGRVEEGRVVRDDKAGRGQKRSYQYIQTEALCLN